MTPDSDKKPYALNSNPDALVAALKPAITPTTGFNAGFDAGFNTKMTLSKDGQWEGWPNPHYPSEVRPTPGWSPITSGDNLVELDGYLGYGTGTNLFLRSDQLFATPPRDIGGITYSLSLKNVYKNRFLVGVSLPFNAKLVGVPSDPNLPDLYDFAFVAGMTNPIVNASYLVYSDMYKAPARWLTLDANYVMPFSLPFMEKDMAPIGIDGSILYLGPTLGMRLNNNWNLRLSAYNTSGSYKQPMQKRVGSGRRSTIVTEKIDVKESGWTYIINPSFRLNSKGTLGFQFLTSKKDEGSVSSYELYLESSLWNDKWSRVGAGLTSSNGEIYYSWSLSLPIDFMSIRKRVWY